MRDYFDEFKKLTPAEQFGRRILIEYSSTYCDKRPLSWFDVTAESLVADVSQRECGVRWEPTLADLALTDADCIDGAAFWLNLSRNAELWAERLYCDFFSLDTPYFGGVPTNHNGVDWWVNGKSEECSDLWFIRESEPLLYGEICVGTERIFTRHLEGIERRREKSAVRAK